MLNKWQKIVGVFFSSGLILASSSCNLPEDLGAAGSWANNGENSALWIHVEESPFGPIAIKIKPPSQKGEPMDEETSPADGPAPQPASPDKPPTEVPPMPGSAEPTTPVKELPATKPMEQQPVEPPADKQPAKEPTTMPTEEPVTTLPVEEPAKEPAEEQPTTMPAEEPVTTLPVEEPAKEPTEEQTEQPTTMPAEEPVATLPVEEPAKEPTEEQPTTMPVEEPVTTLPVVEQPSTPSTEFVTVTDDQKRCVDSSECRAIVLWGCCGEPKLEAIYGMLGGYDSSIRRSQFDHCEAYYKTLEPKKAKECRKTARSFPAPAGLATTCEKKDNNNIGICTLK